jgi:hypothetical protein
VALFGPARSFREGLLLRVERTWRSHAALLVCISNFDRDERRCSGGHHLLLPAEQNTPRYPIAARHRGEARARPHRLLQYLALVRRAEPAPMNGGMDPDTSEPLVYD